MTILGKHIRLSRILNSDTGKGVIVPMDHGMSLGPISGLESMEVAINQSDDGGADAVVVHKGVVEKGYTGKGRKTGLIVHLSASTRLSPNENAKTLVCTVAEAVKIGADGVSVHVNLGNEFEKEMLRDLGRISRDAGTWGMPLMAMMYPRGENVRNAFDPATVAHAARIGSEMGADIVKVSYTGSVESFREVVAGCPVPVVIAGGEVMSSDREILEMVKGAMDAGGAGVSIGRNVFQHPCPAVMVTAISGIVHRGIGVSEALDILAGRTADAAA